MYINHAINHNPISLSLFTLARGGFSFLSSLHSLNAIRLGLGWGVQYSYTTAN
jgi:hypothetical protein